MDAVRRYESMLTARFLSGLGGLPEYRLYGLDHPSRIDERTPTFAVRRSGQHPRATAEALGRRGIFVWDGNYYALEVMTRLGLEERGGAVRIGFCHYHTVEEVDRVLEELARPA
jgi:selenocysteine lyase/cysteine desulfurase